MTAVNNRLGFRINSTATELRKEEYRWHGWNSIHIQCPAWHSRTKKGLEKNVFIRVSRMIQR